MNLEKIFYMLLPGNGATELYINMAKSSVERSLISGDYERDDANSDDMRLYKWFETVGAILSVKQAALFVRSLLSVSVITILMILFWRLT